MQIRGIFEKKEIFEYLESRNLLKQYKKAKSFVLQGNYINTAFKEKQPKGCEIWYFCINKQFRAIGFIDEDANLMITKINNHQ